MKKKITFLFIFVDPKEVEEWSQSLLQLAPDRVATIKKAYGTQ